MKHCGTIPLETEHLLLRRFTVEDIEPMYKNWASNPIVTRYLIWAAHHSEEETRAVIEGWIRQYRHKNFYEWAVVEKATGSLIGSIGLVDTPESRTCSEAGYCFGEPWWNHGYATEALRVVLDLAVNHIGYKRIIAKHAIENPASGRVMQKAGMSLCIGQNLAVSTANGLYHCYLYEYRAPSKRHHFW
ncbi:MAG: GNAT family N-acetyltransferase [Candidatus Merdivicinus sp.]|jgi:ribosomal-protein-alanine N-acetyltransferase